MMKAAINTRYGPPEVVSIQEVPQPVPGKKDLLIKVHTTTVNRTDCGFRSAVYFISRFFSGLLQPKNKTLGCEFSGTIVQVGAEATHFAVGDHVFGFNDQVFGAHAEYMCLPDTAALTIVPNGIPMDRAAAISEGAHYALSNIRAAKVTAGQHWLVNGGTGAIGSAAVQLLRYFDVQVTAVCATAHVDTLKALGADNVIDYLKEDFTTTGQKFDVIFDAVGKSSFGKCKSLLKPRGIYMSTELGKGAQNPFLALVTALSGGKKVLFPIPGTKKEDMEFLKELVAEGKFQPLIDRTYPLEDIVDAYRYVEGGQKIGNVLIKIA